MKIGIIVAMDVEYSNMMKALGGKPEGTLGSHQVVLIKSGIGKVNAAIGVMELIREHRPDCIISSGLAGGIDTVLHVGDVVVGHQTVYHDVWCGMGGEKGQVQGLPTRFEGDAKLCEAAMRAGVQSQGFQVHKGLICTGDQFITNREELDVIKSDFPDGLAVDMESAAIAHTCYLQHVPFLSVRVVSDTPGNTDDHQGQWMEFLNNMGEQSFRFVSQFLMQL